MGFVTFSPAPLRVASKVFFEAAPTVPELVCSTAWTDAAQVVAGATTKMSEKNGDPVQEVVTHTRGFGGVDRSAGADSLDDGQPGARAVVVVTDEPGAAGSRRAALQVPACPPSPILAPIFLSAGTATDAEPVQ